MSSITAHVFRLRPGQDLKQEIQKYVNDRNIKAGWVSTCVGSLTRYVIRFANQAINNIKTGHFEILNLSGTVSQNGSHIHICVSDHLGNAVGGHLSEGCTIFTTAEIVLLSIEEVEFLREADEMSGFNELSILQVKEV